jgi:hypothetical protein
VAHWYLDWEGPRPESLTLAAGEAVLRDHKADAERRSATESDSAAADTGGPVDTDDARSEARKDGPAGAW